MAQARTAFDELRIVLEHEIEVIDSFQDALADSAPLSDWIATIEMSEVVSILSEHLRRAETARHNMRLAVFQILVSEQMSIGEISRRWGISRQLASRLLRDARADTLATG